MECNKGHEISYFGDFRYAAYIVRKQLFLNEASAADYISLYFPISIKCCQISFFLPSSGCKAPGDLREQMWYLRFCSEQSGCFENIHSKASYNTRCESSKAASCVYILISPARKAGVFMHWKLIIQAACSNNLLLLYGAVHSSLQGFCAEAPPTTKLRPPQVCDTAAGY